LFKIFEYPSSEKLDESSNCSTSANISFNLFAPRDFLAKWGSGCDCLKDGAYVSMVSSHSAVWGGVYGIF